MSYELKSINKIDQDKNGQMNPNIVEIAESEGENTLREETQDNQRLNPATSSMILSSIEGSGINIVDPGAQPNSPSLLQRAFENKKVIMKWILIIFIFGFLGQMVVAFIQGIAKTRKPMFLSTFSTDTVPQGMSSQQSDFQSFRYYQKMVKFANDLQRNDRKSTKQEIDKYSQMKFKQFYNLYKVVRTVQLAKGYSHSPPANVESQLQQNPQDISNNVKPVKIKAPFNYTQDMVDVVDQFQCGSCYSFPIAATVEYIYKKKFGITIKLSEQQLIDCAHDDDPGANGCTDGNITKGFEYVRDHGLVKSEQYPYRSITGTSFKCDNETINKGKTGYRISGFRKLPEKSCESIQKQLANGNVVAVMINAQNLSKHKSGVFTDCKKYDWNHAVTIVGQTQKQEWIVRNSWGKGWGENGYFIMGKGNTCGACGEAIVPFLDQNFQNPQKN